MELTREQREVAERFNEGINVAVRALPGAGKTALIVNTCLMAPKPCLILAYNTLLAAETRDALREMDLAEDVMCCTFHSLCSRCIAPSKDDAGIEAAIQMVRDGHTVPHDVPESRALFVDEAQDVRCLYVELLRTLGLISPGIPLMVVGDENQLLYDFDADFPASLDTLLKPEQAFSCTPWSRFSLTHTHRLTQPMAMMVRMLFSIDVVSEKRGPPIDVRFGKAFSMVKMLGDVLTQDASGDSTVLLVSKKAANPPLRALVNELSRSGRPVHIHGVDSDDPDVTAGKLRCMTWWAAKGMQKRTAVVIVPRFTPRNPFFVALTRACHRLVLFINVDEPHQSLCNALAALPEGSVTVKGGKLPQFTTESCLEDSFDMELEAQQFFRGQKTWCWSDQKTLSCRLDHGATVTLPEPLPSSEAPVEDATIDPCASDFLFTMPSGVESVEHALVRMALLKSEYDATGFIRAAHDILCPTVIPKRNNMKQDKQAILHGTSCRFLSGTASVRKSDICSLAVNAVVNIVDGHPNMVDFAHIALAIHSWDSYEHSVRQLLPVDAWCRSDTVKQGIDKIQSLLPSSEASGVQYDVVVRRMLNERMTVARMHARDDSAVYHVVWNEDRQALSQHVLSQALIRAALHEAGVCVIIDALHGWTARVSVPNKHVVLDSLF